MEIKEGYVYHIKNMFPITEQYIDHIDTVQGKALQVPSETRRIILDKVNRIFKLKSKRNKFDISRYRQNRRIIVRRN